MIRVTTIDGKTIQFRMRTRLDEHRLVERFPGVPLNHRLAMGLHGAIPVSTIASLTIVDDTPSPNEDLTAEGFLAQHETSLREEMGRLLLTAIGAHRMKRWQHFCLYALARGDDVQAVDSHAARQALVDVCHDTSACFDPAPHHQRYRLNTANPQPDTGRGFLGLFTDEEARANLVQNPDTIRRLDNLTVRTLGPTGAARLQRLIRYVVERDPGCPIHTKSLTAIALRFVNGNQGDDLAAFEAAYQEYLCERRSREGNSGGAP